MLKQLSQISKTMTACTLSIIKLNLKPLINIYIFIYRSKKDISKQSAGKERSHNGN